jgi:hypothetical protein
MGPEEEHPGQVRDGPELKFSTFEGIEKRRHINVFKVGKLWVLKLKRTVDKNQGIFNCAFMASTSCCNCLSCIAKLG